MQKAPAVAQMPAAVAVLLVIVIALHQTAPPLELFACNYTRNALFLQISILFIFYVWTNQPFLVGYYDESFTHA